MTTFSLIASDYRKHKKYGSNFVAIVFFTQGFWASCQYRVAHFFFSNVKWQPFRFLFSVWMRIWQKSVEITTGISIPASAKIGHSFYIGHFGGIIINSLAVIGDDCNISQGVTIGISGFGDNRGVPVVGDRVYMGVNSVIAGKISIGDNVLIGACSMVKDSVPENAVVSGVPAVVVSQNGSKGYI